MGFTWNCSECAMGNFMKLSLVGDGLAYRSGWQPRTDLSAIS